MSEGQRQFDRIPVNPRHAETIPLHGGLEPTRLLQGAAPPASRDLRDRRRPVPELPVPS